MKDVLAVVGVIAIGLVGYAIYKNNVKKKNDCGCGCGGNCGGDDNHNHSEEVQQISVVLEQPCCDNSGGLGDGWIKNYDVHSEFETITTTR